MIHVDWNFATAGARNTLRRNKNGGGGGGGCGSGDRGAVSFGTDKW